MEDFHILKDELESSRASERQLKDMNVGLLQETAMLRDRLKRLEADCDRYKSYAYELGIRLNVIVETVTAAKAFAAAVSLGKEKPSEPIREETGAEIVAEAQEEERQRTVSSVSRPLLVNKFPS